MIFDTKVSMRMLFTKLVSTLDIYSNVNVSSSVKARWKKSGNFLEGAAPRIRRWGAWPPPRSPCTLGARRLSNRWPMRPTGGLGGRQAGLAGRPRGQTGRPPTRANV